MAHLLFTVPRDLDLGDPNPEQLVLLGELLVERGVGLDESGRMAFLLLDNGRQRGAKAGDVVVLLATTAQRRRTDGQPPVMRRRTVVVHRMIGSVHRPFGGA
jgi:hypothetical protein